MDFDLLFQFSKEIVEFLSEKSKESGEIQLIFMGHDNNDPDSLSAVLGFYNLIRLTNLFNEEQLLPYLPELNSRASNIIKKFDFHFYKSENEIFEKIPQKFILVLLDNNNLNRINGLESLIEKMDSIIIIDHHNLTLNSEKECLDNRNQGKQYSTKIIKKCIIPDASSTAEIIAKIWENWENINLIKINDILNKQISLIKNIALLLLIGIFSDSHSLRYSHSYVVDIIYFLKKKGASLEKVREYNYLKINNQERIARLKGASRIESIIKIHNWFVVFTNVSAFESSVCRALLDLGADIAFCNSTKKNTSRLIVRTSENFQLNNQFDFGLFMTDLSKELDGDGGGHKGAAGLTAKSLPKNLKEIVISKLKERL